MSPGTEMQSQQGQEREKSGEAYHVHSPAAFPAYLDDAKRAIRRCLRGGHLEVEVLLPVRQRTPLRHGFHVLLRGVVQPH